MTGGDERAAVHHLLGAIAAGDRTATLSHLEHLLLALGRAEAAAIVRGNAGPAGCELRPKPKGKR